MYTCIWFSLVSCVVQFENQETWRTSLPNHARLTYTKSVFHQVHNRMDFSIRSCIITTKLFDWNRCRWWLVLLLEEWFYYARVSPRVLTVLLAFHMEFKCTTSHDQCFYGMLAISLCRYACLFLPSTVFWIFKQFCSEEGNFTCHLCPRCLLSEQ